MHLINVETMKLEAFMANPPPYVILSHTWGSTGEEVTYEEFVSRRLRETGPGREKVVRCCQQAKEDGFAYAWIDTCCIDKTNSVELNEAINSMFRWYQDAAICYAYLADVPPVNDDWDEGWTPNPALSGSRWFRRGWTLQELLAPTEVLFYDRTWEPIGTKGQLAKEIQAITGIAPRFLINGAGELAAASVAQRMSWAAQRVTTREEDRAYSLLGIFNANMPMIYGEGGRNAFLRLQEAILQRTRDTSLFAWGLGNVAAWIAMTATRRDDGAVGIWADSPSDFRDCRNIVVRNAVPMTVLSLSVGQLQTNLPVFKAANETTVCHLVLNCGPEEHGAAGQDDASHRVVAIPVVKLHETSNEYCRTCHSRPILLPLSTVRGQMQEQTQQQDMSPTVYIHTDRSATRSQDAEPVLWLTLCFAQRFLTLVETFPPDQWCGSLAKMPQRQGTVQTYIARLRLRDGASTRREGNPNMDKDLAIVAVVKAGDGNGRIEKTCYAITMSRACTLKDLHRKLYQFRPQALQQRTVAMGRFLYTALLRGRSANEAHYIHVLRSPRLCATGAPSTPTIDMEMEMDLVKKKRTLVRVLLEEQRLQEKYEFRIRRFMRRKGAKGTTEDEVKSRAEAIKTLKERFSQYRPRNRPSMLRPQMDGHAQVQALVQRLDKQDVGKWLDALLAHAEQTLPDGVTDALRRRFRRIVRNMDRAVADMVMGNLDGGADETSYEADEKDEEDGEDELDEADEEDKVAEVEKVDEVDKPDEAHKGYVPGEVDEARHIWGNQLDSCGLLL